MGFDLCHSVFASEKQTTWKGHNMSIEVLAVIIREHGFRSRINGGTLYGEMIYHHASLGWQSVWEPIRPSLRAVKAWLGY